MSTVRDQFTRDSNRTCYVIKGDSQEKIDQNSKICRDLMSYSCAAIMTMMIPCTFIIDFFLSLKRPNIYSIGYMNCVVECGCCVGSKILQELLSRADYARIWLLAKGSRSSLPHRLQGLQVDFRERNFIHTMNYHFMPRDDDERWMAMKFSNFLDSPPTMEYVRYAIDNLNYLKERLEERSYNTILSSYKNYARVIHLHMLRSEDYDIAVVKEFYSYFKDFYQPLGELIGMYPSTFRIFFRKPIEICIFLGIDHVRFGSVKSLWCSPYNIGPSDSDVYIKELKNRIDNLTYAVEKGENVQEVADLILNTTREMDKEFEINTKRKMEERKLQKFVHQLLIRAISDIDGHIKRMSKVNESKFNEFTVKCSKSGYEIDDAHIRCKIPFTYPPGIIKFAYASNAAWCHTDAPEGFDPNLCVTIPELMNKLCSTIGF